MEKVLTIHRLHDRDVVKRDVEYWCSRTTTERIAAVDQLREQYHGTLPRLQRVARVVKRTRG